MQGFVFYVQLILRLLNGKSHSEVSIQSPLCLHVLSLVPLSLSVWMAAYAAVKYFFFSAVVVKKKLGRAGAFAGSEMRRHQSAFRFLLSYSDFAGSQKHLTALMQYSG